MNKELITIGADPEVFLKDKDNNVVPAFLLIQGTKESPEPIGDQGHSIQFDNCMAEYQIPPCKTEDEFVKHNKFVLDYISKVLCEPNELVLSITASEHIQKEYLEHPIACMFGCSPDYNAYTERENVVSKDGVSTLRSAGAHLHIAYPGMSELDALNIIKACDLLISVPLVLIEPDSERKQLYGKAGAFRVKTIENGLRIVEYRSPSNFWLTSEDMMRFIYQQLIKAVEFVDTKQIISNEEDIVKAINNNDKDLAKEIIDDYNIEISVSIMPVTKAENIWENDSLGG